jgi:hypothetical protein
MAAAIANSLKDGNPHDGFLKANFPNGMNVDGSSLLCLWYCLLHYLRRHMTAENALTLSRELDLPFQREEELQMADAEVVLPKFSRKFLVHIRLLCFKNDTFTHESSFNFLEHNPNELTLILRNAHFMLADKEQRYAEGLTDVLLQRDRELRLRYNQVNQDAEFALQVFAAQTV